MNFTVTRGDNFGFAGTATLSDSPYDLASCTLWFTAKNKYTDLDVDAVFQKTIGDGITVTNPTQGLFTVSVLPADTADVSRVKTILYWDLQLKDADGKIFTIASGNLIINPDVTITTT